MKTVLTSLAKSVMVPLELMPAVSAMDLAIQKVMDQEWLQWLS